MLLSVINENINGVSAILCFIVGLLLTAGRAVRRERFWRQVPMRYQLLYFALIFVICGIVYYVSSLWHDWYYEKSPARYASVEIALANDCVIVQSFGECMDGEENWEAFLASTRAAEPSTLSFAIHDAGAIQVVHDLYFDGVLYHYTVNTSYTHQDSETYIYPFLRQLIYEPSAEESASFTKRETWVLTDKADLTVEEYNQRFYDADKEYRYATLIEFTDWIPENKLFDPN